MICCVFSRRFCEIMCDLGLACISCVSDKVAFDVVFFLIVFLRVWGGSARVGVGMLRGAWDPLLGFFGFRDLSRSHHREIPVFLIQIWEEPILLDPRNFKNIQHKIHSFSKTLLI